MILPPVVYGVWSLQYFDDIMIVITIAKYDIFNILYFCINEFGQLCIFLSYDILLFDAQ